MSMRSDLDRRRDALSPSRRRLLERLQRGRDDASAPTPSAGPAGRTAPLSFHQEAIWLVSRLDPAGAFYSIPDAVAVRGELRVELLRRALEALAARHQTLRTTFREVGGEPVQEVARSASFELPLLDLRGMPEVERRRVVGRFAQEQFDQQFDLARGPLLRLRLLRVADDEHVLLLTAHHLVCDDWSLGIFWRELAELYGAALDGRPPALADLPLQYADYARWQRERLRGDALDERLRYWTRTLDGELPLAELPSDRARPSVASHRGSRLAIELPAELTSALKELARRERASLFMVLLAAFTVLLQRHCAVDDVVVGTPVTDRRLTETEGLIGLFLNTLVLRVDLSGRPTFRDLVRRVREGCLAAYAHQELPFEKLVEALGPERRPGSTPLFGTYFNFINTPARSWGDGRFRLHPMELAEPPAKFPFTAYGWEDGDRIRFHFVYRGDLYSPELVACLGDQFRHLIEQVAREADRSIGLLSLVTPTSAQLLPDPRRRLAAPRYTPVPDAFRAWVERRPDLVAVRQGDRAWTYGELGERVRAFSGELRTRGLGRREVVAVTGSRGFGLYAAMLAVLESGGVLMTMDPRLPEPRRRAMFEEARATACITVDEEGCPSFARLPETVPPLPEDAAYVFFTSGTTAVPRAVLGRHQGLAHFVTWQRRRFGIGPGDRSAQLTGLSFNVLLRDVFTPLASGACLSVPDDLRDLTGAGVLRWMDREEVTMLHAVPSLVASWLTDVPRQVGLRRLRWVFFAGEPLTAELVGRWRAAFPDSGELVNLYGQTESSMAKCFSIVGREPGPGVLLVGRPMPHTQALVLRDGLRRCGMGELGEVYVRTPFLSHGYLNDPAQDGDRFVPNPATDDPRDRMFRTGDLGRHRPNGELEIVGRTDGQVKILGVRVEPNEVAATLAGCPGVAASAVRAVNGPGGERFLAAYVAQAQGRPVRESDLRAWLRQRLPAAMIPSAFVVLPRLPVTVNGKVDWSQLPEPEPRPERTTGSPPTTETERRLADLWSSMLGVEAVGIDDDFFALGGHSLLAVQLVSRVCEELDADLDPGDFFENPTIRSLAQRLTAIETSATCTRP